MADERCEYVNITRSSDGSCSFGCVYGEACDFDDYERCGVYLAAKHSEKEQGLRGVVNG